MPKRYHPPPAPIRGAAPPVQTKTSATRAVPPPPLAPVRGQAPPAQNKAGNGRKPVHTVPCAIHSRRDGTITGETIQAWGLLNSAAGYVATAATGLVNRVGAGNIAGVVTTAALGALIGALGGIAAGAAATAGSLYAALKYAGYAPYIGGRSNLTVLSAGKGSRHSLGIGLVNKGHRVGHSVVAIDGLAAEQTVGDVPEGIKGTLRPLYSTVETTTEFGAWEDFDAVRGRLCKISLPLNNAANALTQVNSKTRLSATTGSLGGYHYFNNSCTSHVVDICRAAGLAPPSWACTPSLIWYWAKLMAAIQQYL